MSNSGFRSGNPDYSKQSSTDESSAGTTEESKEHRCTEHHAIYCTTITYTTGQSEPITSRFITTEVLHYRTGQMTGMGFCSINLMYVISGIVKVLAVSVSLKRQIPTRPRLLCSSYPSGTATDRVGYFGTVLNVRVLYLFEIPEEYAPKWEFLAKFYATGYGSQCDP